MRLERWVGQLRKGFRCLAELRSVQLQDSLSGVWESKHIKRLKALS